MVYAASVAACVRVYFGFLLQDQSRATLYNDNIWSCDLQHVKICKGCMCGKLCIDIKSVISLKKGGEFSLTLRYGSIKSGMKMCEHRFG